MRRIASILTAALAATLTLGAAPSRAAGPGDYERCEAVAGTQVVQVARTSCASGSAAALALAAAPRGGEQRALAAAGWTAVRATTETAGTNDVVALRGRAVVRVRRAGATPDLDGLTAGRELIFARPALVQGGNVPRGAAICSSAFLIRLNGAFAALSAAHCAGLRSDGTAQRRNAGLRRPPQAGLVLGRVLRMVNRRSPYDALVLRAPGGAGRTHPPIVNRGPRRPPWIVAGVARPLGERAVCFVGRTSGIDRCGHLAGPRARGVERGLRRQTGLIVHCTTIRGATGDSGGPVYTAPRPDGTVRALGIVSLGVGFFGNVCFTPVAPVLSRLGATLVAG